MRDKIVFVRRNQLPQLDDNCSESDSDCTQDDSLSPTESETPPFRLEHDNLAATLRLRISRDNHFSSEIKFTCTPRAAARGLSLQREIMFFIIKNEIRMHKQKSSIMPRLKPGRPFGISHSTKWLVQVSMS